MSSSARRPTPAVYRRRRLAVLLVVLLIVGAVVALLVWQPWRASGAPTAPTPTGTVTPAATASASPSASATATETAPASETPAATEEPTPAPTATSTAEAIAPCTSSDVTVVALMDAESYGSGQKPEMSIQLANEGPETCLINVGTATQVYAITSGSDTWWRSTDCQEKPADQIVQLKAGQTVTSAAPLVWDRTRSSVDTCDADRPSALPGYYQLTVSIAGIESLPTQFRLR